MAARALGDGDRGTAYFERAVALEQGQIRTAYLDDLRRQASGKPGVVLVDARTAFSAHDNERLFGDQMHPNADGQRLIAALMTDAVRERAVRVASRR